MMLVCNVLFAAVLSIGDAHVYSSSGLSVSQTSPSERVVESAIDDLFSFDNEERQQAKALLRRHKTDATHRLFELYKSIRANHRRLYARGKPYERARAEYTEALRVQDLKRLERAEAELSRFDITERLLQDIINLLTEMRSREAAKAFVDSMRTYPSYMWSHTEPIYGEMQALIEMKSFALPDLIEALDTSISRHRGAYGDSLEDQLSFAFERHLIIILGHIGDPAALPILERTRETSSLLIPSIDEAIRAIRGKAR